MKTVKKNVYYCDFCKKKGLSGGAMATHEKHCTGNLNRECKLCAGSYQILEYVKELKKRFKIVTIKSESEYMKGEWIREEVSWVGKEITLDEIRDHADGCPICTLTIIRGLNIMPYYDFQFDYKGELAKWWETVNGEERKNAEYETYF